MSSDPSVDFPHDNIVRVERQITEAEWLDAISLAMAADINKDLKRRVVEELLTMRMKAKLR